MPISHVDYILNAMQQDAEREKYEIEKRVRERREMREKKKEEFREGWNNSSLRICQGKGFQIRFPNGYMVSIQFGFANYCENYLQSYTEEQNIIQEIGGQFCEDAECAVISPKGKFVLVEEPVIAEIQSPDGMIPRVKPTRIAMLLAIVAHKDFVGKKVPSYGEDED